MSGFLFTFDWQKQTHTHTHTYHVKVLLMEFKTLYSEHSLSRLCILNRHFNIILVSAFKVNYQKKKKVLILTSEMTLEEATVARFM